ncbi:MAG: glycosyltransferase family A protein [Parvibaculaceae bacterium]|nr:glycosyltransferase family A protein [Parvibaculaceae bacterium]
MEPANKIEASIVIPSYDRMALLERTLRGCFGQTFSSGAFEIVIADNHPQQLARAVVERLQLETPIPILYTSNVAHGIAAIRNAGVKAARGRFIAFVDDDEEPQPGWLEALHSSLERTGADAAFGPKFPVFESGHAPDWDPEGWYYTCDFRLPRDGEIILFGRRRPRGKGLGTGNSMFRVETCFADREPFNVKMVNGEDTELFFRLLHGGARFVWTPEAIVREFIETSRTDFNYMRRRLMRSSQHYAISRVTTSKNPGVSRIKVAILGLGQVIVHGVLFILTGEFLDPKRVANRMGIAKGWGKLTYRHQIGFINNTA